MRKASLFVLLGVLALMVGGCPIGDDGEDVSGGTPSPSPVPPKRLAKPTPSTAATPFANPVAPRQPGSAPAVTGLVPSLPPEVRIGQIPKGRTDPFAVVPVQPQVEVPANAQGRGGSTTRPVPALPQLPSAGGGNSRANQPRTASRGNAAGSSQRTGSAAGANRRPGTAASRASNSPLPPPPAGLPRLTPELPPIPEPDIALGVEVTGVIEVGGRTNAIVKVPNEPTSRYVQAGQRLSNGQVLVKRIEMNRGPAPVVILEQYGVEVARRVGDPPVDTAEGSGSPRAALPAPPPIAQANVFSQL